MHRVARELSLDALDEEPGDRPAPSTPALLDDLIEQRERLEAIRILPERQQRLVWLQGLGLTYTEMAGQTGTTRRTVERQLLRAKRTLATQA
jgi:RNA polymerase sigma factor (sigma-70 family)